MGKKARGVPSGIIKRSTVVNGHKTSVSLEEPFFQALREIATVRRLSVKNLITEIDSGRQRNNLSSAVRLYILNYYRSAVDTRGAPNI